MTKTRAMETEYVPMISPGMQSHLLLLLPWGKMWKQWWVKVLRLTATFGGELSEILAALSACYVNY